jgi:hypothetical protein
MANFTGSVQWARRRPWSGGRRPSQLGSPPWRRRRWSASCIFTADPGVSGESSASDHDFPAAQCLGMRTSGALASDDRKDAR